METFKHERKEERTVTDNKKTRGGRNNVYGEREGGGERDGHCTGIKSQLMRKVETFSITFFF